MVRAALHPPGAPAQANISTWWVREMAERVLGELESRRATWQSWHVHAEAQRQVRGAGLPAGPVAEVVELDRRRRQSALSVNLTPDLDPIGEPAALRRSDGTSVYRHTGRDHFTSRPRAGGRGSASSQPPGEQRPVGVVDRGRRAVHPRRPRSTASAQPRPGAAGVARWPPAARRCSSRLHRPGRARRPRCRCSPSVWTEGGADVLGLAPSAAAAAALRRRHRDAVRDARQARPRPRTRTPDSPLAPAIGPGTLARHRRGRHGRHPHPATGSSASRSSAGAIVRLIGDDQQLAAIGAGGVLRDIARDARRGAARRGRAVRRPGRGRGVAGAARRRPGRAGLLPRPRPRSRRRRRRPSSTRSSTHGDASAPAVATA